MPWLPISQEVKLTANGSVNGMCVCDVGGAAAGTGSVYHIYGSCRRLAVSSYVEGTRKHSA